jgi:transcriptional regulator with XRE-family HTH domain
MTTPEILDGIFQKQREIGMTNQQFSDASGVPKASIERIKRGDTANPTMDTILALSAAVGFTFSNHPDQIPPVPSEVQHKDPMVQHMINYYEHQTQAYEERIKRITSHFNMLLAEKNRWIQTLATIIGIMIVSFVSFLLMDIATPELGWFPHDASAIAICIAVIAIISLIAGAVLLRKKVKE